MDRRITENKGVGSRFDGFVLSIEKGKALGGLRNVEATEILRRSKSASGEEQEKDLVKYAKEKGCLFSLEGIRTHLKYLDKGGESEVYLYKDGKYVLKVTSYFMSDTPLEFLTNRITLHNTLFPDTAYELVGFCYSYGENGKEFCFITKQPFIEGDEPTPKEICEYMEERGFKRSKNIGSYVSDIYKITDLAPNNMIKSNDGELYCIDSIIYLR